MNIYEVIIHRTFGSSYYKIIDTDLYHAIKSAHEIWYKNDKIGSLDEIVEIRGCKCDET